MNKDSLGDRIKRYEYVTRSMATKKVPLMIRVDGKAFHTFTKGSLRPFDRRIINSMINAAVNTAQEMQGFKVGYVQSDEATFLLTDYDRIETQGWFDYNLSKIISISAATMSVNFNKHYNEKIWLEKSDKLAIFDARAFSVPKDDVVNALLWRAKDWERNSLQMYARTFFSHKELHQKRKEDIHNMLHSIDKNWTTDLTDQQKNGTFFVNTEDYGFTTRMDILPTYDSINGFIGHLL